MRPQYEQQHDRDAEREVIEFACGLYQKDVVAVKMPKAYQVDFGIYDAGSDELLCVAEVKCRDCLITTYPSLILSAHKVFALCHFNDWVPAVVLYSLRDGIYSARATDFMPSQIYLGGRYDRNDWQDMGPVFHIPVKDLKKIDRR